MLVPRLAAAYLARIGHEPVRSPTTEALASSRTRTCAVPFENLDIHLGRPLSPQLGALAAKVIAQRRGGF